MYPRIPWKLVADLSGSTGHTLQTTGLYHQQQSRNDGRPRPKQTYHSGQANSVKMQAL